ncbi:cellulose biosynthesis protein BcsS [Tsuneonella sp. HG222]
MGAMLAFMSVPAAAQDIGVTYAGGGVGDGRNAYAGAVIALPGATLGNGMAIRAGGSAGRYEYETGATQIDGKYVSGEVALVYQTSGDWGWANFGAGPRVTDTSLSPFDPANERAGTRWDLALQTDGAVGYRWRLGWFGSLGVLDKPYNAELRVGRLVSEASQTRVGVETGIAGDDTYTRGTLGVFASTQVAAKTELRVSGGLSEQRGRDAKGYAAVSLSRTF